MLRVLLDTSVVRAAFVSESGASRALVGLALDREVAALSSTALMLQYEEVLLRPATLAASGASATDALRFLDGLCAVCEPVAIAVLWRPSSPDPGDDLVPDAAANGRADVIATFDLRHLRGPAARFGIAAEPPADVLRRVLA